MKYPILPSQPEVWSVNWNYHYKICDMHFNSSPPSAAYNTSVNWVSIDSGNGLSPLRCQAITWTNAGLLSIGLLGTNFSEIRIRILSFSYKKMHLKLPIWQPFCPGGDELMGHTTYCLLLVLLPLYHIYIKSVQLTEKYGISKWNIN